MIAVQFIAGCILPPIRHPMNPMCVSICMHACVGDGGWEGLDDSQTHRLTNVSVSHADRLYIHPYTEKLIDI